MTNRYETRVKYQPTGKAVYKSNGWNRVYTPSNKGYFTLLDGIIWIMLLLAILAIGKAIASNLDVAIAYYNQFVSLIGR